jgi:hypothetical protein
MRHIRGGAQHLSNAKINNDIVLTNPVYAPHPTPVRGYVITRIPIRAGIMYAVTLLIKQSQ